MAAGDLVTLSAVQAAYPNLDAAQTADLPALISAASVEVSARYPRCALAAAFDETHDPGPSRTITLRRRPVLSVDRVRADLARVLTVVYTGPGRRASAAVPNAGEADAPSATKLTLTAEVAGVSQAPVDLPFDAAPTLADLAAAVAAVPDWTATVATGQGDLASADLEPTQGPKPATGGGAGLYGYTRELPDWHLTDPRTGALLIYESRADSYVFPDRVWGTDPRSTTVRVQYHAGRLTVPADVARAVVLIVGDLLEATEKGALVVTQSDEGSRWRLANPSYRFPDRAERVLSRYRDRRFV